MDEFEEQTDDPVDEASASLDDSGTPSTSPISPAPSNETPSNQAQTTIIHHTKYSEKTVYRIVHHQASVAREVFENGRSRIEWSLCPICYKRHDSAFNERILDRVDQVFCAACGQRHGSDYDETIYG